MQSVSIGHAKVNALPPPSPEAICAALNIQHLTIDWLAGDGSDRCYYRLSSTDLPNSLVLMQLSGLDAEALKKGGYDWINIAKLLARQNISVPRVVAEMPDHAALIIEDYGDRMLEGQIFGLAAQKRFDEIESLYTQCFSILSGFLRIPQDRSAVWCGRRFDEERFVWELNFFMAKYAGPVAKIKLSESEQGWFNQDVQRISSFLANRGKFFVHRDFHSRNVMIKDSKLAILDFQDARIGPAAYDLVSLCFDSYVPFDGAFRAKLMGQALEVFKTSAINVSEIEDHWRPMLLQRQLKAIGSFGFLTLDKNKGDYLKYAEPALKTLEEQGLEDSRWPFLSGELIRRLRGHLDARF